MSNQTAKELIAKATSITVFTGAGISTDSGIPDFRGKDGIWTKNPELEKLTNYDTYMESPDLRERVWNTYTDPSWNQYEPNAGHLAIAKLHEQNKLKACITQNIDGLHIKSGIPEGMVHELHGNLITVRCLDCDLVDVADGAQIKCGRCGGINKPNIILFGELLDPLVWHRAETAVEQSDLLLVVGTSLQVSPACDLPILANYNNTPVVYINGDPAPEFMRQFITHNLLGDISETLTGLIK